MPSPCVLSAVLIGWGIQKAGDLLYLSSLLLYQTFLTTFRGSSYTVPAPALKYGLKGKKIWCFVSKLKKTWYQISNNWCQFTDFTFCIIILVYAALRNCFYLLSILLCHNLNLFYYVYCIACWLYSFFSLCRNMQSMKTPNYILFSLENLGKMFSIKVRKGQFHH